MLVAKCSVSSTEIFGIFFLVTVYFYANGDHGFVLIQYVFVTCLGFWIMVYYVFFLPGVFLIQDVMFFSFCIKIMRRSISQSHISYI